MQNHGGWNSDDNQNNNLGRFRLSRHRRARTPSADPLPGAVREILAIPRDRAHRPRRSPPSSATGARPCPSGRRRTSGSKRCGSSIPKARRSWCCMRATSRARRTCSKRGDFLKPERGGHARRAGVPASAAGRAPADSADVRPLAGRSRSRRRRRASIVNRIWQAYFGTGPRRARARISARRASRRRIRELLDWLAVEFMDHGWSLKQLHRLIVTSATYRQSSQRHAGAATRSDPYNRLLARGPRFRVEARDRARHRAGGQRPARTRSSAARASIRPRPAFLFQPPASYGPKTWNAETGRRPLPPRALHVPLPLGAVSGAADLRRAQRRLLLRAPRALEHAAAGADDAERAAVRRVRPRAGAAGRSRRRGRRDAERADVRLPPLPGAAADATKSARRCSRCSPSRQQRIRRRAGSNPWRAGRPATRACRRRCPPARRPPQLAAWTAVSRVLLNLDETITKE